MEEIERLRAKAIASMATTNPNSSKSPILKNSPKRKEEGELSTSDDDDENRMNSAARTTATQPVDVYVTPVNKPVQNSKLGNNASLDNPICSGGIQHRTSVKQNSSKHAEVKSMTSKPGSRFNNGWYAPSGGSSNNLVISFSDDDSESGSEEHKLQKISERKENRLAADQKRRPATSLQVEPKYMQRTANNQIKRIPKKGSLSRTFISSMNYMNGNTSRTVGPLAEQVSRVRNPDPLNKTSASQDYGLNQGMSSNSQKLENLRQQIAIRENQIKLQLQAVQQGKKTDSGSYQDRNNMNLNTGKKSRLASASVVALDSNEPDKKRMKIDKPYQGKITPVGQPVLESDIKSGFKSKMPLPENIGPKDRTLMTSNLGSKAVPPDTVNPVSSGLPGKFGKQTPVYSGNRVPRLEDGKPSMSSLETTPTTVPALKVSNKQDIYRASAAGISMGCPPSEKSVSSGACLTPITSRGDEGGVCLLKMPFAKNTDNDGSKVRGTFGAVSATNLPDKSTQRDDIVRSSECHVVIPSNRMFTPLSNNTYQRGSARDLESKLETLNASSFSTSFLNGSSQINLLSPNHKSLESLLRMEEARDKDLEEAQEHRRRCELEERKALKAYRKAQRALIEANTKCTYLYGRRELFSAKFRASIMEDSSSLWSSRRNECAEGGLNSFDNVPDSDMNPLPSLNHQMQAEFLSQLDRDPNIQSTDTDVLHALYQQKRGHIGSEPCSEPDASTSELLHHKEDNAHNGDCTPSNHTNTSAEDDEEIFLLDQQTVQSRRACESPDNLKKIALARNEKSERPLSFDNAQDYALVEASLRSELFARLGPKTVSKHSGVCSTEEQNVNKGAEGLADSRKYDTRVENHPVSETEQEVKSDIKGTGRLDKSISWHAMQLNNQVHHDKFAVDNGPQRMSDTEECTSSLAEVYRSTASFSVPSSFLKLAFHHTRVTHPSGFTGSQLKTQVNSISGVLYEDEGDLGYSEFLLNSIRCSTQEMGSYTSDLAIDPFWPICMFELRGKCNDDKCPWQHVKDCSRRSIKPRDASANSADAHASGSVLGRSIGQYWQEGFSMPSVALFAVPKNLFSDVRFFDSQKQNEHYLADQPDPKQSVELALILFSGEVNKLEGRKKALPMLSRALEADPTSVILWIAYLHIYYWGEKAIGKDDFFSLAIRCNERSYGLWLLYINSRVLLEDCLVAYDSAISAVCRHATTPNSDKVNASACILDLFLQMVDCLNMSGNIGKAIQRILELLPTATDFSSHGSVLLSDILAVLTVSDKCIFWICCVYIVMYKKLPDPVLHKFEVQKELPLWIEWCPVCLTADEKQKALQLMKMGVDSIASSINSDEDTREAHYIAVSHVGCVAVLEGIQHCKDLLDRYIKLYPTSLELVLASGWLETNCSMDPSFESFEDAVLSWPLEIPGIQCIWNQYAQCALENGKVDYAEQLMARWYESFGKVISSLNAKLDDDDDDDGLLGSSESLSPKPNIHFASNPKDQLFGWLNLSLHRFLQKDMVESRQALDKALEVASNEDLKHCVREHAVFVFSNVSEPKEETPVSAILNFLNRYSVDTRLLPVPELLSRNFCQEIKKSKIRQLINNLLGPISCDYSLINSVLEACYGPSLLPEKFGELKDLIDLVEALMDLFPANYWLALSACKLIIRNWNSSDVASASVAFWASSVLVNSMYLAVPLAPEHVWVEVANILSILVKVHAISERFHLQATSVYPFSVELWKSWYNLSKLTGNGSAVVEAARARGIHVD